MALVAQRTQLKNRIHATLAKYALTIAEVSDLYGRRGRTLLRQRIGELPPQTAFVTGQLLDQIEVLDQVVRTFERQMGEVFDVTDEIQRLMTLPGVGFILGVVIATEVGHVARFPTAMHLASYGGTTPRVHASGGKTYLGPVREDVNHYLKWAFVEAANAVCRVRHRHPQRHVSRLYERIAKRRGHFKAIGAVARHLAEAAYWMLSEHEPYREPGSSTEA
jgi:transposase